MNFEVKELLGFGVYCDGGSINASFGDSESTQHELMFLIDNIASDRTTGVTIDKSACVNSFIESEYVSLWHVFHTLRQRRKKYLCHGVSNRSM